MSAILCPGLARSELEFGGKGRYEWTLNFLSGGQVRRNSEVAGVGRSLTRYSTAESIESQSEHSRTAKTAHSSQLTLFFLYPIRSLKIIDLL